MKVWNNMRVEELMAIVILKQTLPLILYEVIILLKEKCTRGCTVSGWPPQKMIYLGNPSKDSQTFLQ